VWEQEGESGHFSGFNSQRAMPPDVGDELRVQDNSSLIKLFRSIGRWCTNLDKGRVHIEWSWSENRLWLLQLDFEDESPDDGIDPRTLIRGADGFPSEACRADGPLNEADLTSSATGWAKLDKVRQLTGVRNDPYPRLFWVQGSSIRSATFNLSELETEIRRVTNGRAVCRTDCNSDAIEKLNLPRTNSVSAKEAKDFIFDTLTKIEKKGAKPESVCFIIHKFIPAQSAAWSLASPNSQIVRVDSLWGVPDGLQYLPHDSFEYDVKRNKISSERLRYKPAYIQEIEDGSWREVKIARRLGRFRSLREQDIAEVATLTKAIADAEEKSVQVMWFCGIPDSVGIGRNLPWFLMDGAEYKTPSSDRIGPQRPRVRIRTTDDIGKALIDPRENLILVLEPEVELIRKDDEFLRRIIELARAKKISIELHGSRLGHAYYYLERSGLTVVPSDQPRYTRTRGRRVFGKLVRDSIPSKIQQHGEQVRLARIGRGEARAALLVKLMEEIHELKVAESPDDVKAELADVHEVIRSLCAATGVDWIDVEGIAEKKREQRGSFRENVVLLETSWPAGSTAEESEPRQILLRALAQTKVDGNSARMSYATLFAHGADSTLELASGTRIKIELDEVGVRILELKRGEASAMQLQLPLDKKNDE
jgi:predicted house-cleaning noncanonical NTP pyrophosphatase (MazG superfamily)